jgi:hypothetical protein
VKPFAELTVVVLGNCGHIHEFIVLKRLAEFEFPLGMFLNCIVQIHG